MGTMSSPNMLFDLSSLTAPVDGMDSLVVPFETDEIDSIVQRMPTDKAPGLDGSMACS